MMYLAARCLLLIPLLGFPSAVSAQEARRAYSYQRHYVEGEVDRYELRTRTEGAAAEEVGISIHQTLIKNGIPRETVRWISLAESSGGDFRDAAEKVPPYELSLHPQGPLQLVKPSQNPKMMGVMTDLYTFFFAISPPAGITKVTAVGDTFVRPEQIAGDWSDGEDMLLGQDRTELRLRLVSVAPGAITYESAFLPPEKAGLEMHREWMKPPVCGPRPNNFQMVRKQGSGLLVVWGCEEFTVTSKIDPVNGKILSAHMDNYLRWRMKFCKDPELLECVDQPNFKRHRMVDLTLLPEGGGTSRPRP